MVLKLLTHKQVALVRATYEWLNSPVVLDQNYLVKIL